MSAGRRRVVGWYSPDLPPGKRLMEDHGFHPPGALPVYIEIPEPPKEKQ